MSNKPNLSLGSVFVKIATISVVVAALVSTTQSLALYMGGNMLGASAPATIGAAVSGWLVSIVTLSIVHTFILCVATFMFSIFYMFAEKAISGLTAEQRATLRKLVRWALTADFALSLLIGVYNGTVQYGIFSALHADPALNLVTSILSGVITVIYLVPVFAFIGTVATIIFGTFYAVLSGDLTKRNAPSEAPKDGNQVL